MTRRVLTSGDMARQAGTYCTECRDAAAEVPRQEAEVRGALLDAWQTWARSLLARKECPEWFEEVKA